MLKQQTTFPYEILIYDDASTDSTPAIIEEYATLYPDVIKPTLYKENNFQKGLGFYGLRVGFNEARGKYIAYLEGDDYWTNPHKLQKQVDFLESHPDYEACVHETVIRNDEDTKVDGTLFTHLKENIFIDCSKIDSRITFNDTLTGTIFHISSIMFRNHPITWPEGIEKVKALDMILFMIIAERGNIFLMRDKMSVYRHNRKSITSTQNQFTTAIAFNTISIGILDQMNDYWHGKYSKLINPKIARYYVNNMFVYLSKGARDYRKAREMAKLARRYSWSMYCKYLFVEGYYKLRKHLK